MVKDRCTSQEVDRRFGMKGGAVCRGIRRGIFEHGKHPDVWDTWWRTLAV
jgi:hypothetical protein